MSRPSPEEVAPPRTRLPFWHNVLFGPMPLSYPLIAACTAYYLLGVLLSLVLGGFDGQALGGYFWAPSDPVQVALGNGGRAPLLVWHVWTLIDASFLHANLPHIAVNLFCLYQIMPAVEQGFGRHRAFCIYTLAGIAGSIASALWGEFYSLGASGSLFGLLGALLVYGALRRDPYGRYLMRFSLQWAGINFAFGLFGSVGVSNAAHAGGFIGGALAALAVLYRADARSAADPKRLTFVLLALTVICLAIGAARGTFVAWQGLTDRAAFQAREDADLLAKTTAMLAFAPDDTQSLLQHADLSARKGDYAAALADADKALAAGMDTAALHSFRAWLLAKTGRNAEALPEVNTALRASPGDIQALTLRAYLYAASGNRDKAITDYKTMLRLDPENEDAQKGLQALTEGN